MKINKKGFTLIELLAVITIMGILLLVAIPAVSRTIENTRRDTFASVVRNYVNAVRNAVLADEVSCGSTTASGTQNGNYYFAISTADFTDNAKKYITTQTNDLMESGGKSPWGNSDMVGYVLWVKGEGSGSEGAKTTHTTFYAYFSDAIGHGMSELVQDEDITRGKINTSGSNAWQTSTATNSNVGPGKLLASILKQEEDATVTECKLK